MFFFLVELMYVYNELQLWRINEKSFNLRVFNKQFVGLDKSAGNEVIVAVENTPGISETFEIVRNPNDLNRVRIKAPNGFFLQVRTEELVTADFSGNSSENGAWGDNDPSVFTMRISRKLEGEFQVTNGYGPIKAQQVMQVYFFLKNFSIKSGPNLMFIRLINIIK